MTTKLKQANFKELAALKKRKKSKRLKYHELGTLIITMMERNVDYHAAINGHRGFGFSMSQIASMIGYEASTHLMNVLFRMVDDEVLCYKAKKTKRSPLSDFEYTFYTLDSFISLPQTERMF